MVPSQTLFRINSFPRINSESPRLLAPSFYLTYHTVYFNAVPMFRYTEPVMKAFSNETQVSGC